MILPMALTLRAHTLFPYSALSSTASVTLSDNRVAGDVFTDTYTAATFATPAVGTAKAVSVSGISISGADARSDERRVGEETRADLTPWAQTVSAHGVNKG